LEWAATAAKVAALVAEAVIHQNTTPAEVAEVVWDTLQSHE
jgi:hypothetical protein